MLHGARTAILLAFVSSSCKTDPEASGTAATASSQPTASAKGDFGTLGGGDVLLKRPLSDRTAFDLVVVNGRAIVIHDAPGEGLRTERFDAEGKTLGQAVVFKSGARVVEVSAAAGAGRLLVAWIEQGAEGVRARAAVGATEALTFGAPLDLGPASLSTTERGHITAAVIDHEAETSGGARFVVFHRGDKEPCADAPSGCVEFPLHQVDDAGATPRRVMLSVPAPCGRGVAGFATAGDRWYYGVCALRDGRASTTMFTIEHTPEYAQAEAVLPGCVPLGAPVLGSEAFLVGQCGRNRRAVRLGRREAEVAPVGLDDVQLRCEKGVPVVEAAGPSPLRASLRPDSGDVSSVLPSSMAPLDSRALWTGRALLVASGHPTELVVRSYTCGS